MRYSTKRSIAMFFMFFFVVAVMIICGYDIYTKTEEAKKVALAEANKGLIGEVTLPPTPTTAPTPTIAPTVAPEMEDSNSDASSITLDWKGEEDGRYLLGFKEAGSELWHEIPVTGLTGTASGLKASKEYELRVKQIEDDGIYDFLDGFKVTTKGSGFGDPFKDVHTRFSLNSSSKSVAMTSPDGCLNAKVWVQFDTYFYNDAGLTGGQTFIKGGTPLRVTETDEGYCYLRNNGRWSLHVAADGVTGWMDADVLYIDVKDIFTPEDTKFGIQIDRTNAYASIFTAGGSATRVDRTSSAESRYAVLQDRNTVFSEYGYNVIDGITGIAQPNYGGREQMPVIWDMALELLVCQKNALEKGTTLLIYEGYRPLSTSHAVYNAVIGNNYLTTPVNGVNLSRGFAPVSFGPGDYIGYTSRHNKGTAVDLTLMGFIDMDTLGSELKMQTKMHTLDFRCNMLYNDDNADLLYNIMMTGTYLEPLASKAEWWHFQLVTDASYYPQINKYIYADYVM